MQKRKRHGEAASVRERKRHNRIASEGGFFQLHGGLHAPVGGLQVKARDPGAVATPIFIRRVLGRRVQPWEPALTACMVAASRTVSTSICRCRHRRSRPWRGRRSPCCSRDGTPARRALAVAHFASEFRRAGGRPLRCGPLPRRLHEACDPTPVGRSSRLRLSVRLHLIGSTHSRTWSLLRAAEGGRPAGVEEQLAGAHSRRAVGGAALSADEQAGFWAEPRAARSLPRGRPRAREAAGRAADLLHRPDEDALSGAR